MRPGKKILFILKESQFGQAENFEEYNRVLYVYFLFKLLCYMLKETAIMCTVFVRVSRTVFQSAPHALRVTLFLYSF
jgi:hypothetical protein